MINFNKLKNTIHSFFTTNFAKHYKQFFYYLLTFSGCFILFWGSYIRFIYERLPRSIPFSLTEFGFYTLIFICLTYIYAIKVIIKPPVPHPFVLQIVGYLGLPVLIFDRFMKTNRYTYNHHLQSLKYLIPRSSKLHRIFLFLFNFIPRFILLGIFLVDVFWFHYLSFFYYFLFLGLFPMIWNYYKFSLYHGREIAIIHLESLYTRVSIFEQGWDEPRNFYKYDENGYITDDLLEHPWRPHSRNKYHDKCVSIREYIQIVLDKTIDEIEHEYEDNDYYDSPGYLTGASSFHKLNNKRFDMFQKEMETGNKIIPTMNMKVQNITQSQKLIRIPQNEAIVLKYGREYLQYIKGNDYFRERFELLTKDPSVNYDPNNINEQRLLDMCIEHDYRVQHGKPHPKTDYQLQQQIAGKEKQQELQANKKKEGNSNISQQKSKNLDETNN